MKQRSVRVVALLCVVACAIVAAVEVWPAARDVRWGDRNGDDRADLWRRYDGRGQLTEIDVDTNFDGHPDIEEYYQRGVLVRRESDRNFNGQTDLVEEFDPDTHGQTRSVVDIDYDGTADLLVLFRDGRPVFSERAGSLTRTPVPVRHLAASGDATTARLTPLTDPFESEASVRRARITSTDGGFVGLSTSGGLPRPRVSALSQPSPSVRLVVGDVRPHARLLLLPRPSRAPPVS